MTAGAKGLQRAVTQGLLQTLEEDDQLEEHGEENEDELRSQPLEGPQTEESPPMLDGRLLRVQALERLGLTRLLGLALSSAETSIKAAAAKIVVNNCIRGCCYPPGGLNEGGYLYE